MTYAKMGGIALAIIGVIASIIMLITSYSNRGIELQAQKDRSIALESALKNERKFNEQQQILLKRATSIADTMDSQQKQDTVILRELRTNVRYVQTNRPQDDGAVSPVLRDTIKWMYPLPEKDRAQGTTTSDNNSNTVSNSTN